MTKKALTIVGLIALVVTGCSKFNTKTVKNVVVKDVPLEQQEDLLDKYVGRMAWTRTTLEDLTEAEPAAGEPRKKVIPQDSKVEVMDLNFAYNGAVTVLDKKRRRIVVGLEIERPLTVEKMEDKLSELMWFQDPLLRHVDYIREWGSKTARAVVNHEVFIGMPRQAALESWGPPTTVVVSEIGGKREEQWVYKGPLKSKYIYIVDEKVTKWED